MRPLNLQSLEELQPERLEELKKKAAKGFQFLRFPRAASTLTHYILQDTVPEHAYAMLGACAYAEMPFSWGPSHNEVLCFPIYVDPSHQDFPSLMTQMRTDLGFGRGFAAYENRETSWINTFNIRADQKEIYDPDKLTFQIIRNPYDWLISIYSFDFMGCATELGWGKFAPFLEYNLQPDMKYATWELQSRHPFPWPMMKRCFFQGFDNDGTCKVDVYVRYEYIQEGLEALLGLGDYRLNWKRQLSRLQGPLRNKRTNSVWNNSYENYKERFYHEVENRPGRKDPIIKGRYNHLVEMVAAAYAWDLENFNYSYAGCGDKIPLLIPENTSYAPPFCDADGTTQPRPGSLKVPRRNS